MSEAAILYRTWPLEHHVEGEAEPRRWELPRPSTGVHGTYAAWLLRRVKAGLYAVSDLSDDADRRMHAEVMQDGLAAGWYDWQNGPKFWGTLNNPTNQRELMWQWLEYAEAHDRKRGVKRPTLTRKKFDSLWDETAEEPQQPEGMVFVGVWHPDPDRYGIWWAEPENVEEAREALAAKHSLALTGLRAMFTERPLTFQEKARACLRDMLHEVNPTRPPSTGEGSR